MGFFNSGNAPVYLYDPTSSDIIKLNDQSTSPVPEPGKLIIFCNIVDGQQKIYAINSNGVEYEIGAGGSAGMSVNQDHFIYGGPNNTPENKSISEVKSILGVDYDVQVLIDSAISNLIDGADENLNTLKEIADSINNDSDISSTIISQISNEASARQAAITNLENQVLVNQSQISQKVDIVSGKELSTNDFTDEFKNKISENEAAITVNQSEISQKVDIVSGKQLSTNDFTDEFKTKLDNLYISSDGDISIPYTASLRVNNTHADGTNWGSSKILDTLWDGAYDVLRLFAAGATPTGEQRDSTLNLSKDGVGVKSNPVSNYALNVDGVVSASSYNTTSDEKLKKNIKNIPINLIDNLSKIELKSFNYVGDPKVIHYGVIAQQIEKIGLSDFVETVRQAKTFENKKDADEFLKKNKHLEAEIQKLENDNQKIKYNCVWSQKSVNYNNLFILQQALINDQQSVLRTQGLSFLISDIKEVYDNEYDNTYEVLTIQGDLIKSIEKNGNTQQQRIDVWVANGGKVKFKVFNNDEARAIIKGKAEKLILKKYSRDDQRNIDRECLHLKAVEGIDPKRLSEEEKQKLQIHKDMGAYIESILKECEKLKNDSEKLRNGKLQTLVKSVLDGSAYEVAI